MSQIFNVKSLAIETLGFVAFLAFLLFVLQVSPFIVGTIFLCFLIIVITAIGCSLHIREIEKLEEAEGFLRMKDRVSHHMAFLNEIILPAKSRLALLEQEVTGELSQEAARNISHSPAHRFIRALEERLEKLVALSLHADPEDLLEAHNLAETHLHVEDAPSDLFESTGHIPDLDSHLWRDTLEMMLRNLERDFREKQSMNA